MTPSTANPRVLEVFVRWFLFCVLREGLTCWVFLFGSEPSLALLRLHFQVSQLQEFSDHLPGSPEQLQELQWSHCWGFAALRQDVVQENSPCLKALPHPTGQGCTAPGEAQSSCLLALSPLSPGPAPQPLAGLRASRWPRCPWICGARISQTRWGTAAGWLPGWQPAGRSNSLIGSH